MRMADDKDRTIEGYAIVFDVETDFGYMREKIDRTALDDANMDDVRALFNHSSNHLLARTASGTLELFVDDTGLGYRFEAPDTTIGNDVLAMVKRGDLSGSSFAFFVRGDKWDDKDADKPLRTITDIREILDVGPVTYPAYHQTSVRSEDVAEIITGHANPEETAKRYEQQQRKRKLALIRLGAA